MTTKRPSIVMSMLAFATLAAPSSALAQYEYAQWGMSLEQLIAASGGILTKEKDRKDRRIEGQRRLATGTADSDGIRLETRFYFAPKADELTRVNLIPAKEDCIKYRDQQLALLGDVTPDYENDNFEAGDQTIFQDLYEWNDPGGAGKVLFAMVRFDDKPQHCQLQHQK